MYGIGKRINLKNKCMELNGWNHNSKIQKFKNWMYGFGKKNPKIGCIKSSWIKCMELERKQSRDGMYGIEQKKFKNWMFGIKI